MNCLIAQTLLARIIFVTQFQRNGKNMKEMKKFRQQRNSFEN